MKTLCIATALVAILTAPAMAEPVTKTVAIDKPTYSGTRTVTRDKEAGTFLRDTDLTRKSDGATAERDASRTKTATGYVASGTNRGFDGRTSHFDATHIRNETGGTTTGTATARNGQTYSFGSSRTKTETGFIANQHVANSAGTTVYNRDARVTRANGQVTRSVDVTRAQGFHPPHILREGIRGGGGRRH